MDREAYILASIFVKESIFRSYRRLGSRNKVINTIIDAFTPRASDTVSTYNLKWFVAGLLSGLFMAIWIPIFTFSSRAMGLVYTSELLLISYLTMSFIIAIIITLDLVHQVTASIRELELWRVPERLPIPPSTVEKAASYSIIIGGGVSLLAGMGLSIGLIAYAVTGVWEAILLVPAGFLSSVLLVYPLILLLIRWLGGAMSNLVSLVVYVALIIAAMGLYVVFIGIASPAQVYDTITAYRLLYPLPYVYASVFKADPLVYTVGLGYLGLGALLSYIIPSRVGLRAESLGSDSSGRRRLLRYPLVLSLALKDFLLLLRDRARSKQFYGQSAALMTPSVIPLLLPKILYIARYTEFYHVLFIFSLYGLLAYILAIIVSPILVFMEAENSSVLSRLPLSFQQVHLSKTLSSTLLFQPLAILLMIIVLITTGNPVFAVASYYSMTAYWVLGGFTVLFMIIRQLWGRPIAWTELSLGIVRRIVITIISVFPLLLILPVAIFFYIVDVKIALAFLYIIPAPILALIILSGTRWYG